MVTATLPVIADIDDWEDKPMRRAVLVPTVACSVALLAAACSGDTTIDTGTASDAGGQQQNDPSARGDAQDDLLSFGEENRLGPLTVTVDMPADGGEFVSSDVAAPRQSPAWSAEMTITNTGDQPFNPMDLGAMAWVDGKQVDEVIDPENGLDGVVSAPPLSPEEETTVQVAFSGRGETHKVQVHHIDGDSAVWTDKQ